MKEHLGFLQTSSAVVKIAAWIFLFLGVIGGIYIFLGRVAGKTAVDGVINLALGVVFFSLFYLIAKIADLLVKMIHEIHGLKKE